MHKPACHILMILISTLLFNTLPTEVDAASTEQASKVSMHLVEEEKPIDRENESVSGDLSIPTILKDDTIDNFALSNKHDQKFEKESLRMFPKLGNQQNSWLSFMGYISWIIAIVIVNKKSKRKGM